MPSQSLELAPTERLFRVSAYREFDKKDGSRVGHLSGRMGGRKGKAERKIRVASDPRWKGLIGKTIVLPDKVVEFVKYQYDFNGWYGNNDYPERLPGPPERFISPYLRERGDEYDIWLNGEWKVWGRLWKQSKYSTMPKLLKMKDKFEFEQLPIHQPIPADNPCRVREIEWEILPPDEFFQILPSLLERRRSTKRATHQREVLEFLSSMKPRSWAIGKYLGRRQYVVALFQKVAVAECELYGNAVYWSPLSMWQKAFRRTKPEARKLGAQKIVHRGDWKSRVQEVLA